MGFIKVMQDLRKQTDCCHLIFSCLPRNSANIVQSEALMSHSYLSQPWRKQQQLVCRVFLKLRNCNSLQFITISVSIRCLRLVSDISIRVLVLQFLSNKNSNLNKITDILLNNFLKHFMVVYFWEEVHVFIDLIT